ncbi:MAG: cupin domain-containing protein [Bacteroidetes bacterium]|nr:cupin domain-containing protein [Bacteroidota bacterium]
MAEFIEKPSIVKAAGNKEKIIKEFVGAVNTGGKNLSIAQMHSPQGWVEPGQTPEFDEYTLVLEGSLRVKTRGKEYNVSAGQCIIIRKNEWVQYSSPDSDAKYVSVCVPAFTPDTVHRD